MPVGSRQEFRSSQEIDPEKSYSLEDEGAARGYYIGLFGIILKYTLSFLFVILFIAAQKADQETFFLIVIMSSIYIFGWMAVKQAGLKDIAAYETVLDALAWGVFFGFVVRVTEGVVWIASANLLGMSANYFGIDHMSPFVPLLNSPWTQEMSANNPLMFGGYVIVGISLVVAAVSEEMFYRAGMIYGIGFLTDKRNMGKTTATILMLIAQAGVFALLHAIVYQQLAQIIALFAGGIIFGLIFLWKKDLSIPILAHVTLNLSSMTGIASDFLLQNPIYIILIIAGTIIMVYLIIIRNKNSMEKNERE